ncbi:MAG: RtcB family protein [Sandaracinaceae bacterium]
MSARHEWLAEPLSPDVARALARLERMPDVVAIAVMPDVHLAHDVCVGTVTATERTLYPAAVGGDIGCGMSAVRFDVEADRVARPTVAATILEALYARVPIQRHARRDAPPLPGDVDPSALSCDPLRAVAHREARAQLGTIGRGNHFVELQADEEGALWALVHSGSRGIGPAIRDHHVEREPSSAIVGLAADADDGRAYLDDVAWARTFARRSRERALGVVEVIVRDAIGARAEDASRIDVDHNHVQRESHAIDGAERALWVHRKGAQAMSPGALGIVPGSMGTATFHVEGRGVTTALHSASHGAGRAMSRTDARRAISVARLATDTEGVFYDHRRARALREEAPAAYKDIHRVMRAQRELVRIVRELRPVLVYKGGS